MKLGLNILVRSWRGIAGNAVLRSAITSFGLKANAVVFTFGLIVLMSRGADADTFGTFSMLFSASGLFAIVAVAGQQVLLLRNWSAHALSGDLAQLKGSLIYSAVTVLVGLAVTCTGFFIVVAWMLPAELAAAATAYLASLCLVTVSAHLVRTAVGIFIGDGIGTMFAMAPPIAYLAYLHATGAPLDIGAVFWLMTLGGALVLALHSGVMWWKIRRDFPRLPTAHAAFQTRSWTGGSLKLWVSQVLEVSNQYLDVLVVGLLLDPTAAGTYFVITRIANIFGMISAAVYLITTRHFPAAYYAGESEKLGRMLDAVSLITLIASLAGMLMILLFGENLLFLFGDQHEGHHQLLVLLCLGTVLVTGAGPAIALLNIAGEEGRYLRALAISVFMRMLGFLVLIPSMGVGGAVAASAFSLALLAALCSSASVRFTGLDGSVLRLLLPPRRLAGFGRPLGMADQKDNGM